MTKPVPVSFVIGDVRVQPLGPHLVRIEQRGPAGFEDRETFTVVERTGPEVDATATPAGESVRVETATYRVVVPAGAAGLEGIRVESATGETLCVLASAMLAKKFLPAPSALPAVWVLGDAPRIVPPAGRGALPPPAGEEDEHSGWDLRNSAPDAYVFFPAASGYSAFRADFLRLTGGVPLVPLYALGLWYSRYHPYSEDTALAVIDRFRTEHIPLDVFTLDTDWRVGASCGYAINTMLFPDMARFLRQAHDRQVRVMFNDHPEPQGPAALDPQELRFRQQGLTGLLEQGVDVWWYDRNWHTHLQTPAPGLGRETWGMRLYHDITRAHRPQQRPLILSNADGINNGRLDAPSHPAAHRFPVWWTGDTVAQWHYLRMGVVNGVKSGIRSLMPYVHEDLGGHHGQPEAELYVRFMQYGAFAPVARLHCTAKVHRYPWEYGTEVTRIVGDFFRLRYRLLPMLYAAAYEASRSGIPLLRRCDLEWPDRPEAADSTQYLLGDSLLVAPVLEPAPAGGEAERTVWIPPGEWMEAWTGRTYRGPITIGARCALTEYPIYVRRGGMVFSIPQRHTTGIAEWPQLVVDAFLSTDNGSRTQRLYEDDGITTAYEQGAGTVTEFTLRQAGCATTLTVAAGPKRREVVLRIHLPPGVRAAAVWRNGRRVPETQYAVLPPSGGRADQLFTGAGVAPPAGASPVLEWRGAWAAGEATEFRIAWQPD